jgi:hypothetical protein
MLSRVLVTKDGGWIGERFIGYSQVVTAINYSTLRLHKQSLQHLLAW